MTTASRGPKEQRHHRRRTLRLAHHSLTGRVTLPGRLSPQRGQRPFGSQAQEHSTAQRTKRITGSGSNSPQASPVPPAWRSTHEIPSASTSPHGDRRATLADQNGGVFRLRQRRQNVASPVHAVAARLRPDHRSSTSRHALFHWLRHGGVPLQRSGVHWSRIEGYDFKWGHRIILDPNDPAQIYITTYGGGVWHGPAAGAASSAETILTPVPVAH